MAREGWQEEDLFTLAKNSALSGLAKSLDYDVESWLEVATSGLPETLRITRGRNDREWTIAQIEAMGGERLSWYEDGYQMPFARGKAPLQHKHMLGLLHDSGRITRQEAASMLPPIALAVQDGDLVLDMCAAPGSKATQVAEQVLPNGVVIANEPVSGRLNMLVTNRGRLALPNMLISQHDGRHLGRIPPPGFDGVIADVPCTGAATTRKNRNVWKKWTPKASRALFQTQVDIVTRGANLLSPGKRLIYSTCSIDPVENEAVVAQVLRSMPFLKLVEIDMNNLDGLVLRNGLNDWQILDQEGNEVEFNGVLPDLPLIKPTQLSPAMRVQLGEDSQVEDEISSQLHKCKRLNHLDNNTGGFFLALFEHDSDYTPEGSARVFIRKRPPNPNSTWTPRKLDMPKPDRHTVFKAPEEIVDEAVEHYELGANDWSWWHRGKRVNIAPSMVYSRIFDQECTNKKGDIWPKGTFHPMKIIHVGLPAFKLKNGIWRTNQEAIPALMQYMDKTHLEVDEEIIKRILDGWAPLLEDFVQELGIQTPEKGPLLMECNIQGARTFISTWSAARITLMMNKTSQDILRAKLAMPFLKDLEEEE